MKSLRHIKWEEDINQIAMELPRLHKNLFFQMSSKSFFKEINKVKVSIDEYDNLKLVVEIMKIVALARDAHTSANPSFESCIPIEFYWFPEGIYIISASLEYKEYINCKVTKMNGISMDEVIDIFELVISHENGAFLKTLLPKYLQYIELLYGLEIIDEIGKIELTVEKPSGEIVAFLVESYNCREVKDEILIEAGLLNKELPLYRRNKAKNYWWNFDKEHNTLYFNYNSCQEKSDEPLVEFYLGLMDFITTNYINTIAIDLRNNLGGNSTLLDPFINELVKYKKLNSTLKVYSIIGRDTFSSALLNAYSLKNKVKAVTIGEPSGGKPNCYGEVKYFSLNNSKIRIGYSTEFYKLIKSDRVESLFPDVNIEVSIEDYINGIDPCMEYIFSQR